MGIKRDPRTGFEASPKQSFEAQCGFVTEGASIQRPRPAPDHSVEPPYHQTAVRWLLLTNCRRSSLARDHFAADWQVIGTSQSAELWLTLSPQLKAKTTPARVLASAFANCTLTFGTGPSRQIRILQSGNGISGQA
jgi:hypothetical protein